MSTVLQVHSAAIGVATEMIYGCKDLGTVYALAEDLPDEAGRVLFELTRIYAQLLREHGLFEFLDQAMALAIAQAWRDDGTS